MPARKRSRPKPGEKWNPKKHANRRVTPPVSRGQVFAGPDMQSIRFFQPRERLKSQRHVESLSDFVNLLEDKRKRLGRVVGLGANPRVHSPKYSGMLYEDRRWRGYKYRKPKRKK